MADRKSRAQSPGQRAVELIGDHRMNDLVFGHPGRITYTPLEIDVDGADVGDLSSNRSIAEEDTVLQQVTKTAEWFPSTGVASETRSFLKRERRPHRSWLLKGQPQAFMGTLGVDSSIADELKHPSTPDDQERPASLLTVGEITDATDPSRSTGHPALAMAVGQSGHILRIVKLQAENWQWEKGESVSLGLVSAQETEEGHLCGDSVPYHQLKFVSSRKRYSPTRWLLAQKSTRTTIFAPELGRLPISCSSDACSLAATGLPYISIKPVINLSGEKTGGISHRDVAFNPGADSNPPQIAVIDECGNWTVWDIMETRSDGHRKLYPLRRFCGQFINGLMENSVLFGSGQGDSYRLCWVRSKKGLSRWLRDLDSPLGNPHSETGQGSPDDVSSRCESLLLSDRTTVKLFCLTTGRFLRALTMARHNKADRILDVQRSPFDASQVFVLTTSTVFWLDLSAVKESRDPVLTGVKAEDATTNRPIVLLSCPHLRDQGDSTLKIAVLSGSNLGRSGLCLTWIYSARNGLTTLLWLEAPKTGCPARVQHHLFRLGSIVNPVPQQIELLPVSLYYNSEVRGGGQGLRYSQDGARFFQVVFLGPKLSLSSALLAVKRKAGVDIESPSYCYRPTSRSNRRAKAISYLASSFVVSDTFDERSAVPPDQTIPGSPLPGATTVEEEAQIATADFSRVLDVVSQRLAHSVQRVELPSNHALGHGPLDLLENHLQTTHTADRQISLHTLLELAGDFTADFETQIMGNNCTAQLENLKNEFEDLQVAELSRGGRIMSGASLLRALEVMWSESLPEGALDEHALQRRQSLLSHITTLLCLSQTGVTISSVPLPPRESQGSQLTSSEAMELSSSPPGRLPTPIDTASIADSSVGSDPLEPGTPKESPDDQEDEAITRLRRYAVSIKSVPPRKEGQLRLLSHWPKSPGSDPSGYVWSADNARNTLLDEALEKRRKDEARRRRKAAKLGLQRSEDDMAGPSTQPLPHIPHSSQSQAPSAFESQSSLAPVQTMSQPLGGSHGGRPKKQKAKKVGGFK